MIPQIFWNQPQFGLSSVPILGFDMTQIYPNQNQQQQMFQVQMIPQQIMQIPQHIDNSIPLVSSSQNLISPQLSSFQHIPSISTQSSTTSAQEITQNETIQQISTAPTLKICQYSFIKSNDASKQSTMSTMSIENGKQESQSSPAQQKTTSSFRFLNKKLSEKPMMTLCQSVSEFSAENSPQRSNSVSSVCCEEEQLQQQCTGLPKLEEAFQSVKKSQFFSNSELIFSHQYGKQFKLRSSHCKNDDIVFSKIKEYKKNNRLQKEEDTDADLLPNQSSNHNDSLPSLENSNNLNQSKKINSKFHNLNKLFMYKLLATFSSNNLQELEVPAYLHETLMKLIIKLKHSTKEMKKYNKKTEFFSHDHYNLLFLHLNERTIGYILTSPFSLYLHRICFGLDLTNLNPSNIPAFAKEQNSLIQYINIIKRFCCQIVQNSNMLGVYLDSPDTTPSQREHMRQAYTQRALKGILSLNQGIIIRRF